MNATVVGGGLAGSEAAWALAERGVRVTLYEMRPVVPTPAHRTDRLAELVCSNTFKSVDLTNAHGLLKAELRALGSLLLPCADEARVPGGTALAVDREIFSRTGARSGHLAPQHHRRTRRGDRAPLAGGRRHRSAHLRPAGARRSPPGLGTTSLAFYDAIAPVVADDSLDHDRLYALSRYGKGGGDDYLNVPLDREGYERFLDALIAGDQYQAHDFDQVPYFEGCLPVEEMARRGRETLRFGPMKPVGLPDPRTGREPHAVVQLRREDRAGQMWNLVGFQTRLRIAEQQRVFRMLPGTRGRGVPALREPAPERVRQQPGGTRPRAGRARRRPALLRGAAHRGRGIHRVARHRPARGHQPRAAAVRAPSHRPAPDHDARRALPLPARRRSEALPADECELRAAGAVGGAGTNVQGSQEGASGRAGPGGFLGLAVGGRVRAGQWSDDRVCHPERSEGAHAGMAPFAALRVTCPLS